MPTFKPYTTQLSLEDYPEDFAPSHRRILSARNIPSEQLQKSLTALLPVDSLTDAQLAAQRLYQAINKREKIVIVGDYDADGATAMSVMLSVLKFLDANYDSIVPNRVSMGYGLSEKAVEQALIKKAQLLITVDNGISATESVERLNSNGVEVIITDHHLPPETLPPAYAIVNPNREDCNFASKALAGVGVAFYVVLALRSVMRAAGDSRLNAFAITDLLPFVAIGTVADVVPMDFNNRILVEQGLKRIRAGKSPAGIRALIEVAQLNPKTLTSSQIGFQLAPRLNAAGRIADMQLGVDCLLAHSERLAMDYAIELNRLNHERRTMENEMRVQADALLQEQTISSEHTCICLFDAQWNEGLIGILASRIKESHEKTAFVFTSSEHGLLKASARSGAGVNLIHALNSLNRAQPQLMSTYGGHAKAAGISILPENLEAFRTGIEHAITEQLRTISIDTAVYTDGELLPYELNIANAEFIRILEPWGSDLPEPLFENSFYLDQVREVGKNHAQLAMIEEQSGKYFKGIAFNQFSDCDRLVKTHCRVAYRLDVNEWRGDRSLSLQVTHIKAR